MKIIHTIVLTIFFARFVSGQEAPAISKTEFPDSALAQPLYDPDGQETTTGTVLRANKGKVVLLYIWATWCPDCLKGFPQLYAFQKANPDVRVVYFSLDRDERQWLDGIRKFKLEGEHYWFKTGWKNDFTTAIDLNWIPRYLIIGPDGRIAEYYAVKADDPALQKAVDAFL
jgi:Thiol-disulfide isomerase and thioredoxins